MYTGNQVLTQFTGEAIHVNNAHKSYSAKARATDWKLSPCSVPVPAWHHSTCERHNKVLEMVCVRSQWRHFTCIIPADIPYSPGIPFTICDYGTADGIGSIPLFNACIGKFKMMSQRWNTLWITDVVSKEFSGHRSIPLCEWNAKPAVWS